MCVFFKVKFKVIVENINEKEIHIITADNRYANHHVRPEHKKNFNATSEKRILTQLKQ